MDVNIFESNIINEIDKERNLIEKPTFKTIQRDFSNYFKSKYSSLNLDQLKIDKKSSRIIFKKEKKCIGEHK